MRVVKLFARANLTAAIATLAIVATAGCGGSVSADQNGVHVNTKTLDSKALTFTFDYPADWAETTDTFVKSIPSGRVAVGIPDTDSYAVVLSSDSQREKSISELMREAAASGAASIARERHAGLPMGRVGLLGTDSSGRHGFQYAFAAGGRTWILQCTSESGREEEIRDGCRKIVDTIKIRPGAAALTRAEYIAAADRVCALAKRQITPLERRLKAIAGGTLGPAEKVRRIAELSQQAREIVTPAVEELATLAAPAAVSARALAYVEESRHSMKLAGDLIAAIERNDSAAITRALTQIDTSAQKTKREARAIGLRKCD